MATSKKHRAADEFARAQAFYQQAMMYRRRMHFDAPAPRARAVWARNARDCIDSCRFHLAQCGAILGLNPWPV